MVPAAASHAALFVYPFLYGLVALVRAEGGRRARQLLALLHRPSLWPTICDTLKLALPATLINVGLALPVAFKMRRQSRRQRWLTTILVLPITLGTVLIAEGC